MSYLTHGHILSSSSLEVANPRSLLSVTTLSGSVHRDIASGRHSRVFSDRDTGTRNSARNAAKNEIKLRIHCIIILVGASISGGWIDT